MNFYVEKQSRAEKEVKSFADHIRRYEIMVMLFTRICVLRKYVEEVKEYVILRFKRFHEIEVVIKYQIPAFRSFIHQSNSSSILTFYDDSPRA